MRSSIASRASGGALCFAAVSASTVWSMRPSRISRIAPSSAFSSPMPDAGARSSAASSRRAAAPNFSSEASRRAATRSSGPTTSLHAPAPTPIAPAPPSSGESTWRPSTPSSDSATAANSMMPNHGVPLG